MREPTWSKYSSAIRSAHSLQSFVDRTGLQMSLHLMTSRFTACTVSCVGFGGKTAFSFTARAVYEEHIRVLQVKNKINEIKKNWWWVHIWKFRVDLGSLSSDPTQPDPTTHGPNPTRPTEKHKTATRPDPTRPIAAIKIFTESLESRFYADLIKYYISNQQQATKTKWIGWTLAMAMPQR